MCSYFFAIMHSTQCNEGMNSFSKIRVTVKNFLFYFVQHYNNMLTTIQEAENLNDQKIVFNMLNLLPQWTLRNKRCNISFISRRDVKKLLISYYQMTCGILLYYITTNN